MSGDEPTKAPPKRKPRATRYAVHGAVIEVTPGDDVNPKTLAAWVAENVALPPGDGILIVRQLPRDRWDEDPVTPHPAPEVPARIAQPGEIPRGVKPVRAAAEASGWYVVATYARGTKWNSATVVDSLALRMWHDGRRAVAVWAGGRFSFAMRWGVGIRPETVGVKELTSWL